MKIEMEGTKEVGVHHQELDATGKLKALKF
jgi:hypothetical protein